MNQTPKTKTISDTSSNVQNGPEASARFFNEWGLPWLREHAPTLVDSLAAGLFHGSQVLGADDALSRDHGWGPMFWIILPQDDYNRCGPALQEAIRRDAPRVWAGCELRDNDNNVGIDVVGIDAMLDRFFGCNRPPSDLKQWLPDRRGRDGAFHMLRHGILHYDPAGWFAQRRAQFERYPRPIWLHLIGDYLFDVWHFGEYNFLQRLVSRGDEVAIMIALGRFVEATMRLSILLDDDYAPYWKWVHFVFRKTPAAATLDPFLQKLASARTTEEKIEPVRSICAYFHARLTDMGLANPEKVHLWDTMEFIGKLARASMSGGAGNVGHA